MLVVDHCKCMFVPGWRHSSVVDAVRLLTAVRQKTSFGGDIFRGGVENPAAGNRNVVLKHADELAVIGFRIPVLDRVGQAMSGRQVIGRG